MNADLITKLKDKYKDLHPLIFHRSVEKAKTPGDLFDILDTIPAGFPLTWSEEKRRWVKTNDLFLARLFFKKKEPDVPS